MMFANKSYIDEGILVAAGSDSPVIDANPLLGIWGAVVRKDIFNGVECGPNQKISVMDAIRMFTINGAYASFDEGIKGSIEVGKLADFIVLSEDILLSEPERIREISVTDTYIDGKLVFQA